MSRLSSIFTKDATFVPKRSGFDLSHDNLFTAKCGTLTPSLVMELLPNTTISVSSAMAAQLPPLATDFMGKVDIVQEAFFIPYRLLYGGFMDWYTSTAGTGNSNPSSIGVGSNMNPVNSANHVQMHADNAVDNPGKFHFENYFNTGYTTPVHEMLPYCANVSAVGNFGAGTLSDYLGMKVLGQGSSVNAYNIMPYLAYHKVYNDYYRNSLKEKPVFVNPAGDVARLAGLTAAELPFMRCSASNSPVLTSTTLNDGVDLFSLRQRNYCDDYFTSAKASPTDNASSASTFAGGIMFNTNDGEVSGFTIPQLRAANTLTQFFERNNVSGFRYKDAVYTRSGITPPDLATNAVYLGRSVTSVYNNSVKVTTSQSDGSASLGSQPWSGAGQRVSAPTAGDNSTLVDNFTARELGCLMVIFTLVPHCYYGTGTRKYLHHQVITDFGDALLQNVGKQAIRQWELTNRGNAGNDNGVFGWTQPYAEYMYMCDEVHGLFRSGESLDNFVLQRSFATNSNPIANKAFQQILQSAMDDVCAADAEISDYGVMVYDAFKVGVVQPLNPSVIPTLGTPEHMRKTLVSSHGSHLQ